MLLMWQIFFITFDYDAFVEIVFRRIDHFYTQRWRESFKCAFSGYENKRFELGSTSCCRECYRHASLLLTSCSSKTSWDKLGKASSDIAWEHSNLWHRIIKTWGNKREDPCGDTRRKNRKLNGRIRNCKSWKK